MEKQKKLIMQLKKEAKGELKEEPKAHISKKIDPKLFIMESNYGTDIVNALRIWTSEPLINAYFHKAAPIDIEMQSLQRRKSKAKKKKSSEKV